MYSAVGRAERKVVLEAAYELAGNLTAVQQALAQAAGIQCEAAVGEGGEGGGEGETCEVENPVPAMEAVRLYRTLRRPLCMSCVRALASAAALSAVSASAKRADVHRAIEAGALVAVHHTRPHDRVRRVVCAL